MAEAGEEGRDRVWSRVMGRIVQGFLHDVNNRLVVLVGVRDLLEEPAEIDADLLDLFDRELDALGSGAQLLNRLVAGSDEPDVASSRELLGIARKLHARHRGLDRVPVEWRLPRDLPAVELPENAFLRAVLLLLAGSATAALDGADPGVVAQASVDGHRLVVRISPSPPADGGYVDAARVAARRFDGRIDPDGDGFRLTAPALAG